ncbi:hypothetical protein DFH09DRAFT_1134507 [Mycena vulgaris]|nr:hypothetical protein DFH09DRAFT_1134507 [Mycena vulgaris]
MSTALLRPSTPPPMLAVLHAAFRLAPTAAKYLAILLFVLNAGSWPLVWHLRVFSSVIEARLAIRLVKLRHVFSGREKRAAALERLYESRMPIGVHPFRKVWTYRSWVSIDDSDFNLHMSNSSYAKALDSARFRLALATFPSLLRCGGWIPLAATHYHFIREIPMLSRYEVRASIGAWDDKWIWVISRFVKPPSKKSSSKSVSSSSKTSTTAANSKTATEKESASDSDVQTPFIPSLKTPVTPLVSGATTPVPQNGSGGTGGDPSAVAQALLARAARDEREPDGAVLYTIAVSQLCLKVGRITVPPAVVLAANGFYADPAGYSSPPNTSSTPSSSSTESSKNAASSTNITRAPPYWSATVPLRASMRALRAFYAGGWREERWWEEAFRACEGERRGRVVPFAGEENGESKGGIKGGLEGVRGLV